jgi:hypothetical protein
MEKMRKFRNPYELELVDNVFRSPAIPRTDPTDPDSDRDGLPDGFVDGWIYQTTNVNRSTALRLDSQNNRFAQVDSFRYDIRRWAPRGEVDSLFQVWEFEDFNGNGLVDGGTDPRGPGPHAQDTWDFDRGTRPVSMFPLLPRPSGSLPLHPEMNPQPARVLVHPQAEQQPDHSEHSNEDPSRWSDGALECDPPPHDSPLERAEDQHREGHPAEIPGRRESHDHSQATLVTIEDCRWPGRRADRSPGRPRSQKGVC